MTLHSIIKDHNHHLKLNFKPHESTQYDGNIRTHLLFSVHLHFVYNFFRSSSLYLIPKCWHTDLEEAEIKLKTGCFSKNKRKP